MLLCEKGKALCLSLTNYSSATISNAEEQSYATKVKEVV